MEEKEEISSSTISFPGEDSRTEEHIQIELEEEEYDHDELVAIYEKQNKQIAEMKKTFADSIRKMRTKFQDYVAQDKKSRIEMLDRITQLKAQIARVKHLNQFDEEQKKDRALKRKQLRQQKEKEEELLQKEKLIAYEARREKLQKLGLDPDKCFNPPAPVVPKKVQKKKAKQIPKQAPKQKIEKVTETPKEEKTTETPKTTPNISGTETTKTPETKPEIAPTKIEQIKVEPLPLNLIQNNNLNHNNEDEDEFIDPYNESADTEEDKMLRRLPFLPKGPVEFGAKISAWGDY